MKLKSISLLNHLVWAPCLFLYLTKCAQIQNNNFVVLHPNEISLSAPGERVKSRQGQNGGLLTFVWRSRDLFGFHSLCLYLYTYGISLVYLGIMGNLVGICETFLQKNLDVDFIPQLLPMPSVCLKYTGAVNNSPFSHDGPKTHMSKKSALKRHVLDWDKTWNEMSSKQVLSNYHLSIFSSLPQFTDRWHKHIYSPA
jgi:hypothetical protein